MLPRNLEKGFISPFVEHITGKNVIFSLKKTVANLKNFLVAEKAQLSIACHLEISLLLLMSAEKHRNANFCIFEALFF